MISTVSDLFNSKRHKCVTHSCDSNMGRRIIDSSLEGFIDYLLKKGNSNRSIKKELNGQGHDLSLSTIHRVKHSVGKSVFCLLKKQNQSLCKIKNCVLKIIFKIPIKYAGIKLLSPLKIEILKI